MKLRPVRRTGAPRCFGLAILFFLAACSGSDSTGPKTISCQEDPTQQKCQPSTPTGLRDLAAARNRWFGVAVDATFFGVPNTQYNTLVAREFNMIVAGNVMKWSSIHRDGRFSYRWTNPDLMVTFAQTNTMKVRGHTLAWHQQNPTWFTTASWNPDTLRAVFKEHIDSVVGHYKGKIHAWDVVNEALNDGTGSFRQEGPLAATLGRSYIEFAFREARAIDPAALLFYNDYNLESPGAKQDSAYALVSDFKSRGVPIDGIGFQGHFQINSDGSGMPSLQTLSNTFNRFAALGIKIEITELDIRVRTPGATTAELSAQAQGYANVVAACLAVASCDAIVVWGVNDGESWIPGTFPGWGQPLLFDDAYSKKATYNSVKSALGG